MNQLIVSGRVSKEITVKGKTGFFTLANDRDYPFNKDQNGNKISNFLTVKILGEKNVQRAQQYLTKGTAIIVTGHYFRDSWKAQNEYKEFNYVLCEKWEFQIGKTDANSEGNYDSPYEQVQEQQAEPTTGNQPSAPDDFVNNIPDDLDDMSLPFR